MLGKKKQQLAYLEIQWTKLEWEMAEVKGSNADPDEKSYHLGELQCMQMSIEEEIEALEDEIAMFPLKLMLGGFVIFVIGMTVYMML